MPTRDLPIETANDELSARLEMALASNSAVLLLWRAPGQPWACSTVSPVFEGAGGGMCPACYASLFCGGLLAAARAMLRGAGIRSAGAVGCLALIGVLRATDWAVRLWADSHCTGRGRAADAS